MRLDNEKINSWAKKYVDLNSRENEFTSKKIFEAQKNECIRNLFILVDRRSSKYKRFSNYEDLSQDGKESLLMALNSYCPEKGNFLSWADYYIKTKISRKANKHSTIQYPMSVANENKPHKIREIPNMNDPKDYEEEIEDSEQKQKLRIAINKLPILHQKVLDFAFDVVNRTMTMKEFKEKNNLAPGEYKKILREAESEIKNYLLNNVKGNG